MNFFISWSIDVMKFDIENGSFLSAVPYLVMGITCSVSGLIVDWLRKKKIFTTTQVCMNTILYIYYNYIINTYINNFKIYFQIRKLFNCSAFISQTIFMYLAANSTTRLGFFINLTFAVGLGAFAWSGFR